MTPIHPIRPELTAVQDRLYEELPPVDAHFQSRARREGHEYDAIALGQLERAGAKVVRGRHKRDHYTVDGVIDTPNGGRYLVLAHGNLSDASKKPGLRRTDTVSKVVHRAVMLHERKAPPVVVVTSHLPRPGSEAAHHLADLHLMLGSWVIDVIDTTEDAAGFRRLRWFFTATPRPMAPRPAPWWSAHHHPMLLDEVSGSVA